VPPLISNEPIGPGSSVGSETDPIKLCSAAAFAYLANLPGYVFHSRAGIYGYQKCCPPGGDRLLFEHTPGIEAFRHLQKLLPPDVANWVRNDGIRAGAPFKVFCNGRPNLYWPDFPGATNGCVRNIGSTRSERFVCLPMGIHVNGLTLAAWRAIQCEVFNPLTGEVVLSLRLKAEERFTLERGPGAYLIAGKAL